VVTLLLRFRSEDMLAFRFAISPLNETTDALRSLSWPGLDGQRLSWLQEARQRAAGLGIGPLLALMRMRGYQPDFLNPAPDSPATEIGDELARVRATPPALVAAELAECLDGPYRDPRGGPAARRDHPLLNGDPADARDALAGMLHRAWTALVEPLWPRLRDVLDADITYRARRLADAGLAATLAELDPRLTLHGPAVRYGGCQDREVDAAGATLVLIPSVFQWPHSGMSFSPPAVIYPARGALAFWHPGARSSADLIRLIGRSRATLLTALAEPASTTGLAVRTGIPVSSVSEQLSVLRAAGLVSATRTGRFLVHQRTPLGAALAGTVATG
jgi:hypothetical protein